MSSSPSAFPTQQAPIDPFHSLDFEKYRQTVYYDDAGWHVAESCRRSRVDPDVLPAPNTHLDWTLFPVQDAPASLKLRPVDASSRSSPFGSDIEKTGLAMHVTSAKRRSCKVKPKVVIVDEARKQCGPRSSKTKTNLQAYSDRTPPLAPRLRRLTTPDLPDLDESPFCNCGVGAHVIKLCASCNKGFEDRSS
ncbi:hypothetical protein BKA66DRAFT_573599 [Pyrenochaeta sp. MPI-SDFR-AT-0127]|nr:hypothetical protein BKA66DRAFT_573599 [Pyrenochaeta sp. MPI-SDFR-AT-0127]